MPAASDGIGSLSGSHNLWHKASFNNDENLVIVKWQRDLAETYATDVLDIYDHSSWRWLVQQGKVPADAGLKTELDEWQSRYDDDDGSIRNVQLRFWLAALPSN